MHRMLICEKKNSAEVQLTHVEQIVFIVVFIIVLITVFMKKARYS